MKITIEQKQIAVRLYDEMNAQGLTSKEICAQINETLGLNCEESTYRKAHAAYRLEMDLEGGEEAKHQHNLVVFAKKDLGIKEERKKLVRQRAVVDLRIREYTDKELMMEIAERVFGIKASSVPLVRKKVEVKHGRKLRIFSYSDLHWGYTIDNGRLKYNKEITMDYIDYMFECMRQDIAFNGWDEVIISDGADDIEGSALRPSQMLHIMEMMCEQAKGYADYLQVKIKELAEHFPSVRITFVHVRKDNHSEIRPHGSGRNELPEYVQYLLTSQIDAYFKAKHEDGKLLNLEYVTADEVVLTIEGMNILFVHGQQYNKGDDILKKATHDHDTVIHFVICAHFHQYSYKSQDVFQGIQRAMVFLPAVCGDTDYSDTLHVSGRAGFVKSILHLDRRYLSTEQILID